MDEQTDDDEVVDVAVCPRCSIMTEHIIKEDCEPERRRLAC